MIGKCRKPSYFIELPQHKNEKLMTAGQNDNIKIDWMAN
jgi:hypothetical protein